jgi:hypothetical protein
MTDRTAPTLDQQLAAVSRAAQRWRELVAIAIRSRYDPKKIDEMVAMVEDLDAAAATLRTVIAAQPEPAPVAGSERAA